MPLLSPRGRRPFLLNIADVASVLVRRHARLSRGLHTTRIGAVDAAQAAELHLDLLQKPLRVVPLPPELLDGVFVVRLG